MKSATRARAPRRATIEEDRKRYNTAIQMLKRSPERRLELWEQISTLLDRSFDLPMVFQIIWAGHSSDGMRPNAPIAVVAAEWRRLARDNVPFSEMISACANQREKLVIDAGLETGTLPEVLRRLGASERIMLEISQRWKDSIRQPIVNMAWSWAMMIGFCYMIMWEYTGKFHLQPKGYALTAYNFSNGFLHFWSWLIPLIAVIVILAVRYVLPNWLTDSRPRFEHLWPFNLYKAIAAAEFLQALSIFISARHDISPSLKKIAQAASPYLRWQVDQLEPWTRSASIGFALQSARRAFPDPIPNALIQVFCHDAKTFPHHLAGISENYAKEMIKLFDKNMRMTAQITFGFAMLLNVLITILMTATGLPS